MTIDTNTACTGTNFIFIGAYLGSFDPDNICTNWIGDSGSSPNPDQPFQFNVDNGQTFVVVVSEVTPEAGCPSLHPDGDAGRQYVVEETPTPTPTPTPTATPGGCQFTGSIDPSDPTQIDRLFRSGIPQTCPASTTCAVFGDATPRHYDEYTFTNTTGATQCVTVDTNTACTGTNFIFIGAYLGSFDPDNICTNWIGDSGSSPNPDQPFQFNVDDGQTFVVVVSEVTPEAGCPSYTVTVTPEAICGGGTPSPTPTATATATATATPTATATATHPRGPGLRRRHGRGPRRILVRRRKG